MKRNIGPPEGEGGEKNLSPVWRRGGVRLRVKPEVKNLAIEFSLERRGHPDVVVLQVFQCHVAAIGHHCVHDALRYLARRVKRRRAIRCNCLQCVGQHWVLHQVPHFLPGAISIAVELMEVIRERVPRMLKSRSFGGGKREFRMDQRMKRKEGQITFTCVGGEFKAISAQIYHRPDKITPRQSG